MIIKCYKNSGELEFSEREDLSQSDIRKYFRVTIRSSHLFSYTDVWDYHPRNSKLLNFFEDLAKNWKGFNGEKKWSAGEFTLICTSDRLGHFVLEATIRNNDNTRYTRKTIYIESGQLEKIALEARRFFKSS